MILEGIVTTLSAGGQVNIAPMGPRLPWPVPADGALSGFLLRPYHTSRTWANLREHPEGVLHVTDDALLLARAAIGVVDPLLPPPTFPSVVIRGQVLATACRAYEFRVRSCDASSERTSIEAEVVYTHRLREFFGFNRARHAVVEAAILATRTAFLPLDEIDAEYRRLMVAVEKTGGPDEHRAMELLRQHLAEIRTARALLAVPAAQRPPDDAAGEGGT